MALVSVQTSHRGWLSFNHIVAPLAAELNHRGYISPAPTTHNHQLAYRLCSCLVNQSQTIAQVKGMSPDYLYSDSRCVVRYKSMASSS